MSSIIYIKTGRLRIKYELFQSKSSTVTMLVKNTMGAAHGFILDFGRFWKILKKRKKTERNATLAKTKTVRCD